MIRNNNTVWVSSLWMTLTLSSCQNDGFETERKEALANEGIGTKNYLIGDSIRIIVPENWARVNSSDVQFALKEDCDKPFCENMVCYRMDNINQYTRLRLGEVFVQSLSDNYDNFRLIHSNISTPDSSIMSFDYLLTSNNLKLGGTTYIYVKGDKAVVFSFMGYNGDKGDYVTVRKKVTDIMDSIEFI